jgi:ornithine carbamoyltransferase
MKRDILKVRDLTKDEILSLIKRALETKGQGGRSDFPLRGKTLGLIFDKPSTRTRVSFETAMFRLGGSTIYLGRADTQMSRNEPICDTARVLSRYLDALAIRTYGQDMVEEMARWSDIPVLNALTDMYHPCQILSDLMTVKEKKGKINGLKIAWVGDGNNVANSWIDAAGVLGFDLTLACPRGFQPDEKVLSLAAGNVKVVEDPVEAVRQADVVNTDVWASMGQEQEHEARVRAFQGYQVNRELLSHCKPDVIVMHCLPAHRGEEITEEVLEGPKSVVFDQSENKMHMHQALLEWLLGGDRS